MVSTEDSTCSEARTPLSSLVCDKLNRDLAKPKRLKFGALGRVAVLSLKAIGGFPSHPTWRLGFLRLNVLS